MWNPKHKTVDISKVIDNLFAYLAAHQVEALAKFQPTPVLPPFKKFYTSASGRLSTIFPCLMLIKKEAATDFSSDVLKVGVRLLFEGQIQGGNADLITAQAEKYSAALESMLVNITPNELKMGVLSVVDALAADIETDFDVLRGNKGNKAFLQGFQTQITYTLIGAAF